MNPYLAKKVIQAYNHVLKATELLEHVQKEAGEDEALNKQASLLEADLCISIDKYIDIIEEARNATINSQNS